jgi:hypothetical protein
MTIAAAALWLMTIKPSHSSALVEAGHPVVPIHPNAVKASRPRYRASGARNDRSDAYLLADLLRTDVHRLPSSTSPRSAIRAQAAIPSSLALRRSSNSLGPA